MPNLTVVTPFASYPCSPFSSMNISLTNFTVSCHMSSSLIRFRLSRRWMILSLFMGTFVVILPKFKLKDLYSWACCYL